MGLFDFFKKNDKDDVMLEIERHEKEDAHEDCSSYENLDAGFREDYHSTPYSANDTFDCDTSNERASLKIEDVFVITGRGCVVVGVVAEGTFHVGDSVRLIRNNYPVSTPPIKITGIEAFRKVLKEANVNDTVGFLISGVTKQAIMRGDLIVKNM